MKILLFAAALTASGVALAQNTDTTGTGTTGTTTTETTTSAPAGTDPNGPNVPPGDGITQQGTDPAGQPAPPPGANQPLEVPPGATVVPAPNQASVFTPQPAQREYPPCSKTVTDGCVQTYERGVRRR